MVGLVAAMNPSGLVVVELVAPPLWESYSWVSCQLKSGNRIILLVSLIGLHPVPRRSKIHIGARRFFGHPRSGATRRGTPRRDMKLFEYLSVG